MQEFERRNSSLEFCSVSLYKHKVTLLTVGCILELCKNESRWASVETAQVCLHNCHYTNTNHLNLILNNTLCIVMTF